MVQVQKGETAAPGKLRAEAGGEAAGRVARGAWGQGPGWGAVQSTHLTSAGGQTLGWSADEMPLEDEQQRHGAPTLCQPLSPESRSTYSVPASAPRVTERLLCASLCAQSHGAPTLCQPLRPESWSAYSVPASAPRVTERLLCASLCTWSPTFFVI